MSMLVERLSMEDLMIEGLTDLERECLEHLRCAQARGVGLAAYARAAGLKFRMLYDAKRRLIEKGVAIDGGSVARCSVGTVEERAGSKGSSFVAVRVADGGLPGVQSALFRVRHAQGHVLEFTAWPPAEVMAALLAGGLDAAA
jgi:hypothetical protein